MNSSHDGQAQPALQAEITGGVDRRSFLMRTGKAASAAMALATGAAFLATKSKAVAPAGTVLAPTIEAVLQFALNLEYLEAEFYLRAAYGNGLNERGLSGPNGGSITVKENSKVPFQISAVQGYALEIAQNETQHVQFIQNYLTQYGLSVPSRPALDLRDSFNALAQAAVIGDGFDPFSTDLNFILGSFLFEDVGVTAYNGAAGFLAGALGSAATITALNNETAANQALDLQLLATVVPNATSILAVEAYHAGLLRLLIFQQGTAAITIADKAANLRGALSGVTDPGLVTDTGFNNLIPVNNLSLAYQRTPAQVANIVYGNSSFGTTPGLFFPNGINIDNPGLIGL